MKTAQQIAPPAAVEAVPHALGRLRFLLSGEDGIAAPLHAEFRPVRIPGDGALPQLEFRFGEAFPPLPEATRVQPVEVAAQAYRAAYSRLRYHVSREQERLVCRLYSTFSPRELMPHWLQRALNWNYLTSPENQAKNFMYAVFDYLSQAAQLPLGQSYLHASSFTRGDKGVAVVAWGGVGKTTAMLKLVSEHGWRYLSDDLAVLDEDGTLWRSPKRMQVYAYNLLGEPVLARRLARRRSPLDRLTWHARRWLEGPGKVRRRVSAERFFGAESTASSAPLTHAYFLERADVEKFVCRPMTLDEIASRSAATLLKELEPFHAITSALHTAGCHDLLPTAGAMEERSREILRRGFARTEPLLVRVPRPADPHELSRYVLGLVSS